MTITQTDEEWAAFTDAVLQEEIINSINSIVHLLGTIRSELEINWMRDGF